MRFRRVGSAYTYLRACMSSLLFVDFFCRIHHAAPTTTRTMDFGGVVVYQIQRVFYVEYRKTSCWVSPCVVKHIVFNNKNRYY